MSQRQQQASLGHDMWSELLQARALADAAVTAAATQQKALRQHPIRLMASTPLPPCSGSRTIRQSSAHACGGFPDKSYSTLWGGKVAPLRSSVTESGRATRATRDRAHGELQVISGQASHRKRGANSGGVSLPSVHRAPAQARSCEEPTTVRSASRLPSWISGSSLAHKQHVSRKRLPAAPQSCC